ncbi:unnamed protein product [Closterium sp. NIES-65]|nr:unnamed protein product [Closterium sp. NIES-65]
MFHFIPAKVSPFEWNGLKSTLLGSPVELRMSSDSFSVANVTVTRANAIKTKKYDVHTISSLLFPPTSVISSIRGGELGSANAEPAVRSSAPILSRHGVRRDSFRDPVFDDDSQEALFTDPHEVSDDIDGRRLARRQFYARPRHGTSSDGWNDQSDGGSSGTHEDGNESSYEVWENQESGVDFGDGGLADVRRALAEDATDVTPRWEQGSAGGGGAGEAGGDAARRSALLEQMLSADLRLSAFAQGSDPGPEPPVTPSTTISTGVIIGIAAGGIALLCSTVAVVLTAFLCLNKKRQKAADVSPGSKINNTNYDPESAAAAIAAGAMAGAGAGAAAAGNHIHSIIVGGTSDTPLLCHQYPLFLIKQIHEMASKHHPNLVRLLGFCLDMDVVNERTEQILIYEYMLNGDLETWVGPGETERPGWGQVRRRDNGWGDRCMVRCTEQILIYYEYMLNGDLETWVGPEAPKTLTLSQRFNILIGAAHGLEYLHSFGIVHRDIKLANILLDRHMHAKVADFGLVRMGEGTSVGTTRILGTPGYVDPAYTRTRRATTATDVYSYGIVILEVMTGQRAMMGAGERQINIKDWADHHVLARDANSLKDPRLDIPIPDDLMLRIARFALTCTSLPTANRPTMSQIYTELKNMKQECFGVEENVAANLVDAEISSVVKEAAIPLDEQIAQIELASDASSMGAWKSNPSGSGVSM